MRRVLVLGGSGMLGSALIEVLAEADGIELRGTVRDQRALHRSAERFPGVRWTTFDALADDPRPVLESANVAINAIGLIKQLIRDDDAADVDRAIRINSVFPHRLARAARDAGCAVVQIATDCVYSGARGGYTEEDPHDALDVYGKTKSLGEVRVAGFVNLRCSIIGREQATRRSLLEWLLGHPAGARVPGYTDHVWNGVTTTAFAEIVRGIVTAPPAEGVAEWPQLQHVVPADRVTKSELLRLAAEAYGRSDLRVEPTSSPHAVDRTLVTARPDLNERIWRLAGHRAPPTIAAMLGDAAARAASARTTPSEQRG